MASSQFDEKFYQGILRTYENDDQLVVTKIEIQPACEKGSNYVSIVNRVTILGRICADAEYTKTFVVKTLPSEEQCKLYRSHIATENEANAYNKILPELKKYGNISLPFAKCVYASNEIIVLEDLATLGYAPVLKARKGITYEECVIVLQGLARFHAASFVLQKKQPKVFEEIRKLNKELLFHEEPSPLLHSQVAHLKQALLVFQKLPDTYQHRKCQELLTSLIKYGGYVVSSLMEKPRKHSVMCHGDVWNGNILFDEKRNLKLIDLQSVRYNSVASELSYFLYVNLEPSVLFRNMRVLLDLYLSELLMTSRRRGVDVDISYDWLEEEMIIFAEHGVIYAIWNMPAYFIKNENVDLTSAGVSNAVAIAQQAGPEWEERLKDFIYKYLEFIAS